MAAANRFDIVRLKRLCESHLCKYITADSVTEVLVLADSCHATELKDVCLKFSTTKNLEGMQVVVAFSCYSPCNLLGAQFLIEERDSLLVMRLPT